jgi:hypothetical protein
LTPILASFILKILQSLPKGLAVNKGVRVVMGNEAYLRAELTNRVQARTGRRVRNLAIVLLPERVILRGLAGSFHVKQLAQQGVREVMPDVSLENAIEVA